MAQIKLEGKDFDSLTAIREAIEKHFQENPTHHSQCACLDTIIAEVRRRINPLAFNYAAQNRQSTSLRNARWATLYVFRAAIDRG